MVIRFKIIVTIIWSIAFFLSGCSPEHNDPIESIICVGMPINDARIALNKEELSEFVMEFPRDQENVKRYWFTKEHNLVLQIMHKPVSNESEVMQEVISQISLVPRKLQ